MKREQIDKNVAIMAAGYVVDELPQNLVESFLKEIKLFNKSDILSEN